MKLFLYSVIKISLLPITTLIDVLLFVLYVLCVGYFFFVMFSIFIIASFFWGGLLILIVLCNIV